MKNNFAYELSPNRTEIKGKWVNVFDCVKNCHELIHSKGGTRIYTTLKVNKRTDKRQLFKEKFLSLRV